MTTQEVDRLVKRIGEDRYSKLQDDMRSIASKFKDRVERNRDVVTRPISPTGDDLKDLDDHVEKLHASKTMKIDDFSQIDPYEGRGRLYKFFKSYIHPNTPIHPQSNFMTVLLGIQTIIFIYNAVAIPLRVSFRIYQTPENNWLWALLDYLADSIYLLDTLSFKPRLMFLDDSGIYESKRKETTMNFIKHGTFKTDALSLMPTDLLYFWTGFKGEATLLRLPRLLRYYNFSLFFDRLDAALPFPTFVRLSRTVTNMLFLMHMTACSFYAFSDWEGIGGTKFVYDGMGNAYFRCFYITMKTAISVGMNVKPDRELAAEMIFMGTLWLLGIFVFAVLIGNVKDIIAQGTRSQDEFMFKFDQISQYMYRFNVPEETMERVKEWCQFTWKTQKSFDELAILEFLPFKMRTDVALDVHFKTLRNVKLFHGCDPGLLKSLVLKLQPMLFLPNDYICRKGDIGKEMFIITTGQVQVVGGPDDSIVFVTLGAGICFGEIALLGSGNMNRRTANVRAHGYTNLYVLFKEDLNEALNDYPEDRALLALKAQKAALEVAAKQAANVTAKEDEGAKNIIVPVKRAKDPKLLEAVKRVLPQTSYLKQKYKFLRERGTNLSK